MALLLSQGANRFAAPAGDFSTLESNGEGTFTRRFKDGIETPTAQRIDFPQCGGGCGGLDLARAIKCYGFPIE